MSLWLSEKKATKKKSSFQMGSWRCLYQHQQKNSKRGPPWLPMSPGWCLSLRMQWKLRGICLSPIGLHQLFGRKFWRLLIGIWLSSAAPSLMWSIADGKPAHRGQEQTTTLNFTRAFLLSIWNKGNNRIFKDIVKSSYIFFFSKKENLSYTCGPLEKIVWFLWQENFSFLLLISSHKWNSVDVSLQKQNKTKQKQTNRKKSLWSFAGEKMFRIWSIPTPKRAYLRMAPQLRYDASAACCKTKCFIWIWKKRMYYKKPWRSEVSHFFFFL